MFSEGDSPHSFFVIWIWSCQNSGFERDLSISPAPRWKWKRAAQALLAGFKAILLPVRLSWCQLVFSPFARKVGDMRCGEIAPLKRVFQVSISKEVMEGGFPLSDLKALENLLATADSSKEASSYPREKKNCITPASIGPKYNKKKEKVRDTKVGDPDFEIGDKYGRLEPEYEFVYKQAVTTSDVYFQLSGKNASSICCEDLVLRIKLPNLDSVKDIKLDLQKTHLKLSTPI